MDPDPVTAELLAMGPFARTAAPFAVLEVAGLDAGSYLQSLCSQDVLQLTEGRAAPATFLDAKGKLLVTCAVQQRGDSFWLEAHSEQRDSLAELLERYHFAEKVEVRAPADWTCSERIGAAAIEAPAGLSFTLARQGVTFVRAHGPTADAVALSGAPLSEELAECLRMAAGFVRVGVETEPSTLALEAGLDDHCSATKGCYTGQEIVARIHTYGHTNRKLCLLHLGPGAPIDAPEPLHEREDNLAVGRVMHAVPVPGRELRFGLGYLPKDFQAPGTKLALATGGEVTVVW